MSDFTKNILVLLSGTTIAQALPIVLMPVLTRFYSPEDFGVFAIFVAVSLILGAIANARYELALTLPESLDEAISVAALGIVIAFFFSVVLLIPFVLFNSEICNLFNNNDISVWLYFIPLVVLMIGIFNIFNFLNTRLLNYKDIAAAHIHRSVAMVSVQLVLGLLRSGAGGLIVGQISSHLAAVIRGGSKLPLQKIARRTLDFRRMKVSAVRFRRFFIYMFPATLMNSLSNNFIVLYLPSLFSLSVLGFFSLAQRALGAPSALIGSSIGQVYMQEASAEKIKTGIVKNAFVKTFKKLVVISFLLFAPLYFIVEDLFALVFGEAWRIAGQYTEILLPYFAINFIVSSLSVTDSVMEKQYWYAIFNAVMLFGLLMLSYFVHFNTPESFFIWISTFLSIVYCLYLLLIYFVARGKL